MLLSIWTNENFHVAAGVRRGPGARKYISHLLRTRRGDETLMATWSGKRSGTKGHQAYAFGHVCVYYLCIRTSPSEHPPSVYYPLLGRHGLSSKVMSTLLPAHFDFNTLPDAVTRASMGSSIKQSESTIDAMSEKINLLEIALAKLVAETKSQVDALAEQKRTLEKGVASAKGYLAPVRKLPADILSDIFMMSLENDPLAPWTLSAVNKQWRTTALTTPRLWSRIRIQPPAMPSGNALRLWVERSGGFLPS
ncbi:hypothetical protein OPQ81_000750 [Rhizoctonia solani]|nr:hypothetical protein OPQ81_000750 [Rhizoctonia solani]